MRPGGHRGLLREQCIFLDRKVVADGMPGQGGPLQVQPLDLPWPTPDQALPLEVVAGTLRCFGSVAAAHCSAPDRSARSRGRRTRR